MTDLVERLRHYIGWRSDAHRSECHDLTWQKPADIQIADEAASRISQQDAELERLREALKPFALAATIFEQEYGDRMKPDTGCNIKFAVLCQARATLRAKADESKP